MRPTREFDPVIDFDLDINRSERAVQARWLVPLLAHAEGVKWFLIKLGIRTASEQDHPGRVFHLCFPLRDIFTKDYYQCRGNGDLEPQFIDYYNMLFGLPAGFGVGDVWRTSPGSVIRHPGAPGRAGWYDEFLRRNISDADLYQKARDVRGMLGTEADILLLTPEKCILIECKFKSSLRPEQYERQKMMGNILAHRLERMFHFGLVVEDPRDPEHAQIDTPYVLWTEIRDKAGTLA